MRWMDRMAWQGMGWDGMDGWVGWIGGAGMEGWHGKAWDSIG